uniref:F-box domain-containing protein n=1 Tax=Homalodisca liturata TaxID=320908 RepID=A0A1B6JSD4_9HEMI
METLPEEMVEEIANHLTVNDLIACSAVCSAWREAFNQDSLWKPYCNKNKEEYLRVTPKVLTRGFEIPWTENSTLSPVCHWRMAYMRENYLRNNWRMGRYWTQAVIDEASDLYPCVKTDSSKKKDTYFKKEVHADFFTNDLMLIMTEHYIELWSLLSDPVVNVCRLYHNVPGYVFKSFKRIETDPPGMILVFFTGVQVFYMDPTSNTLFFKHMFYFNENFRLPQMTQKFVVDMFSNKPFQFVECLVVDRLFFGVNKYCTSKVHVWDLEKGTKLREVGCPINVDCNVVDLKLSKEDGAILVVFARLDPDYKNNPNREIAGTKYTAGMFYFFVYDSKKLAFLPFSHIQRITNRYSSVIQKPYIAVSDGDKLDLYNYFTSVKIRTFTVSLQYVGVTDKSIIFQSENAVQAFITSNRTDLTMGNMYVSRFGVIHENFVRVVVRQRDRLRNEVWEVGTKFRKTGTLLPRWHFEVMTNPAGTRLLVREKVLSKRLITVKHFW